MSKFEVARCPKLPWLIDFHSTGQGEIPNSQMKAAYAKSTAEYLKNLNINSKTPRVSLTSITCTLGPSCATEEMLEKMMLKGMNIARINMSFYDREECLELIKKVRISTDNVSRNVGRLYPVAIAIDLKGTDIRTGTLKDSSKDSIELVKGNTTNITTDPTYEEHVTEDMIYVDYQKISEIIEPGDNLYLDDGKIILSALKIIGSIINCLIENTGLLKSHCSVLVPEAPIDLPFISDLDIEHLKMAIEEKIDIIMVGVSEPEVVKQCKEILGEEGKDIFFIAKIETTEGIQRFDLILPLVDGVMLSRAKIALELPQEKLFLAQKSIVAKCNAVGKPVICAPQMLESMSESILPTRSEISDIANAILDGTDGLLLSKETTVGKNPYTAIETIIAICKEAEAAVYQRQIIDSLMTKFESPIEIVYSIAMSAVEMSLQTNAAVIIVTTTTGRTARLLAKFRPRCPIIAVTRSQGVARKLAPFRAVDALIYLKPTKHDWNKELMRRIQLGITYGKMAGYIRAADAIVMVTSPKPGSGFTNAIKVVYASEFDALVQDIDYPMPTIATL